MRRQPRTPRTAIGRWMFWLRINWQLARIGKRIQRMQSIVEDSMPIEPTPDDQNDLNNETVDPTEPHFYVPSQNGPAVTGLIFCCEDHLYGWAEYEGIDLDSTRHGQARNAKNSCCHCYWCGRLALRPTNWCFIHDNECPGHIFDRSAWAAELIRAWFAIVHTGIEDSELEALRHLGQVHREMTAYELVRLLTNK